jgi:hypothetical protein
MSAFGPAKTPRMPLTLGEHGDRARQCLLFQVKADNAAQVKV